MTDRHPFLRQFEALVRTSIEPVVRPAGFEWNSSGLNYDRDQNEVWALFEAEPDAFARTFPTLMADYGGEDPGCIDLWIHFNVGRRTIEADVDGTDVERWFRAQGHLSLAEALSTPSDLETATRSLSQALEMMLSQARAGV
ncbi:MAG TPA: hypothetical protein VGS09_10850 [Actinomycetota bacterium]|jgi:hypothetical protein|nr:hypothetical protein [Actinomycetota bacterium]